MTSLAPLNPFKQIKRIKKILEHGPIEEIAEEAKSIATGVVDSLSQDLIKESATDMWREILGTEHTGAGEHDMHEGQEIDLSGHAENEDADHTAKEHAASEPHINYRREILHYRENSNAVENNELSQKVNEILYELKRLIDSSEVVQAEFREVTVSLAPAEVGKYHVNFFEWMLLTIQDARMKVEDSGAWLATMSAKKGKKDYWGMFKKHGTSFGMSNERGVATQTG